MDRSALRLTVVGVGAIGTAVLPLLRHRSIAHLQLVDGDIVEVSNLPRQLLYHAGDVGRMKVHVAKERMALLVPELPISTVTQFMRPGDEVAFFADADVVLDCCDDLHAKRLMSAYAAQAGLPLISAAVHRDQIQVSTQMPGSTPLFTGRIADEQATCDMHQVNLPVVAMSAAVMVHRLYQLIAGTDALDDQLDLLDVQHGRWMRIHGPQDPMAGELIADAVRNLPHA
jgi:molybdopterin/thiamine biosynthesis adenylyltransferase